MFIAFIFAAVMNIVSYWYSDKIVLKLHSASPVDEKSGLHRSFEELLKMAEIAGPKLYIYNSDEPNAFATGRNYENSVVAVSTKLVETLTDDEVNGVLAHEIAHIENKINKDKGNWAFVSKKFCRPWDGTKIKAVKN